MRPSRIALVAVFIGPLILAGPGLLAKAGQDAGPSQVSSNDRGLHGYISFTADRPPARSEFSAGMGFYSAVWPLVGEPISHFQIGLPSAWITPDNSDNKDTPLAPVGTYARDNWPGRGPTYKDVFQTVEGGLGYWAGNHFRYGPPKFSMNATPQCYDYEVGSPGWSFFYDNEALPDERLGIAQLSNRLLIPPDALPFQGDPNGEFLGYAYMALPFTEPVAGEPPTGDQAWTCFLSAANFKGPIAYYIPETWSKIGKLFNYPFIYGRGLDSRPGVMGGGAMEINTVPAFESRDAKGVAYTKLADLRFPVDGQGRTLLVQDVTYYSKGALYDAFKAWRDGGPVCSGAFNAKGAWRSTLKTETTRFDQGGKVISGVEKVFDTRIFDGNVWGLEWFDGTRNAMGHFPMYFRHAGDERVVVPSKAVPAETRLHDQKFERAVPGAPYTWPAGGAWGRPGPVKGPYRIRLADGSIVTYSWYRFVDQPSFQQYAWSAEKKAKVQAFVEKIHAAWPINRDYMAPPRFGKLATLDPALLVTPPKGLEKGYVPIVTRQEAAGGVSAVAGAAGRRAGISEFRNVRRGGIIAMSLRPKSQLIWSRLTDGKREIIIATRLGKAIRFSEKDIRPMGRTAAGVRGMSLAKKDEVIGMVSIGEREKYVFTASEKGYGKRTEVDSYRKTHRGGKGLINLKVTPKIGPAVAVLGVTEDDLLIVTASGKVIRIQTKQVRASGRATQGVRLINLENGDKICSVAKAEES